MTITNQEYAEAAIKANEEGRALKVENDKLTLVDPQPMKLTGEQIITQNQQFKESLLKEANIEIDILNDKLEFDAATNDDITLLKKWKLYRINLKKLDVNDINLTFPERPY
ncbi:tail fiber assembly protein [Gilliamella apicola]|uniref:Tail fiber assembly protein n=1 Tax=Gilliamella apicola TaxID=1196095 RepID=A0A2V4ENX5_9GAMM|nr:tail fiber assembly protein [Gilliamella apicola]PXZ06208.1 hypothetical protein DKK79_05980 [Gilliamella apicola]